MSELVRVTVARVIFLLSGLLASGWATGCRPVPAELGKKPTPSDSTIVDRSGTWVSRSIGAPVTGQPWLVHLLPWDLDHDGQLDLLACDAKENRVVWLRQKSPGQFEERVLAENLPAPVHVAVGDVDQDGRDELWVACMGRVFPTNDRIGAVVVLLPTAEPLRFEARTIASGLPRVTDVQIGDLDGDGRPDLALALFGYNQGEVAWWANRGGLQFEPHRLSDLSGAINVVLADFDGDRRLDVATILSQEWERVLLFRNRGEGQFETQTLFSSSNEDFGSSNLVVGDVNRDGRPDLIFTNGDGFDLATPGPRPWHGVNWLENLGEGKFRSYRVGALPGAYGPLVVDLDADGAMDIVALGTYADWRDPSSVAMMCFRQTSSGRFTPEILAHRPSHLLTVAAGAFGRGGQLALVTGAFHAYPPFEQLSRATLWERP